MNDQDLMVAAYVDGELDAAAQARFEAEMARDPSLSAEVTRQRRLRERLAAAFDPVLSEPVPLSLTMAAEAANDPPAGRFGLRWRPALAASLAASLAVGLAVGLGSGLLVGRAAMPQPHPLAVGDQLAGALDRQLAADTGPIRIGLSFQDDGGRYCRTFQSVPHGLAGLACRDRDGWRLRTATVWSPATSDYRTAGAETPPEVLVAVDALIAGDALDAAGERAARARDWTRPPPPAAPR